MHTIAVILPCYNEATAIADVVKSFQSTLPEAMIYVYDNASTDDTISIAKKAGAQVRMEPTKGKGNVIRRAFAEVDADIYLMADGDGTYDATAARKLIDKLLEERLDMVVGKRLHRDEAAYRAGHQFGNKAFTAIFRQFFGAAFSDVLSGYRVFSRRFVKTFPSVSRQFEIEIELSAHAAYMRLPTGEVATYYAERPEGSESKLNTYRDGFYILVRLVRFLSTYKPLFFFSTFACGLAVLSLMLGLPIVKEFFETGLVPRFPTAVLATGIMLSAVVFFATSLTLDISSRYHAETKRLSYLRYPGLSPDKELSDKEGADD